MCMKGKGVHVSYVYTCDIYGLGNECEVHLHTFDGVTCFSNLFYVPKLHNKSGITCPCWHNLPLLVPCSPLPPKNSRSTYSWVAKCCEFFLGRVMGKGSIWGKGSCPKKVPEGAIEIECNSFLKCPRCDEVLKRSFCKGIC
jgi:hypothetical protein